MIMFNKIYSYMQTIFLSDNEKNINLFLPTIILR